MYQLPISFTLILGISTFIASLLYIREYFLRRKDAKEIKTISMATRQKTAELLNAAQMVETDIIAEGNYTTKKLIAEFKAQLQDLIKASQDSISLSQDQLIHFMADLQKRSTQFEETSNDLAQQRINQLFEKFEARLSDFLIQTEQKSTSSIELELKAARQLIETYKNQQYKLIDENILAMMEQTLNLVLGKKLSLKDQLDLVYEALEKAKAEKFVV